MFTLPKSTEFNKRIPKQKFYNHLTLSPTLKKVFTEQIDTIIWKNKIAPSTLSLAAGKTVTEIEVFEVNLRSELKDDAFLRQIDKEIPYHILFILKYLDKSQAWIGYKEESSGNTAFKVSAYYHTEWETDEDLTLSIDGLDMDAVYENFVRQISGGRLDKADVTESLKNSVERDEIRKKLQKQINALEKKSRAEKQWNLQMEIDEEIRKLKKEMEKI
jgi:hypothetical protein